MAVIANSANGLNQTEAQHGEDCPTGKSVAIPAKVARLARPRRSRDHVRGKTIFFRRFNLIWVVQWCTKK
jgi:hypothetical protein